MTSEECQKKAVLVLINLEPKILHVDNCPGHKNPEACTCYMIRNARARAAELDEAGLLCCSMDTKE